MAAHSLAGRALVVIWVVTLLMTFGRTTFGSLYDILPGSSDIFIRRFEMGVQLSGILLAGVGIVFLGQLVLRRRAASLPRGPPRLGRAAGRAGHRRRAVHRGARRRAGAGLERHGHLRRPQRDQHRTTRREADAPRAPDRPAAGLRAGPPEGPRLRRRAHELGQDFTVGDVPVFKYLESKDIDEVGYTLRTASLMTDPEYYFDESNPGDYPLFGIGYIITPADMASPVAGRQGGLLGDVLPVGAARHSGYIHVYDTTGELTATRADVGTQSTTLLDSPLLGRAARPHGGLQRAAGGHADRVRPVGAPGLARTRRRGARRPAERRRPAPWCTTNRRSTVVLSASYDPGWHATVNGRPAPTVMVAPALVGVVVGPGVHTVTFSYAGYGSYNALFVLALVVLARARRRAPGVAAAAAIDGTPRRGDNGCAHAARRAAGLREYAAGHWPPARRGRRRFLRAACAG